MKPDVIEDGKSQVIEQAIQAAGGQLQLAERLGLSQSAVHKMLHRKTKRLAAKTAVVLSELTGVSVEELAEIK